MDKQAVVVTGVSSGIGRGTVQVLLDRGFRVFGSVRKEADAQALQAELGPAFRPLLMDVTDERAVAACADQVRRELAGSTLRGLVNNAGFSVVGPLLHQPIDDMRRQLEVNVIGPAIATQAFAPLLGADRALKGRLGAWST